MRGCNSDWARGSHQRKGLTDYGVGSGGAGARIAKAAARMEEGLIPRGLKGKFFIDVFSGTANLSFAIVHAGIRAFVIDVQDGDDGDIWRAAARRHIYCLMRHPQCAGIWFGMPCGTFSRVRRGGGTGPAALRGETRATGLYGMPGLSEKDAAKVALANELLRFMTYMCKYDSAPCSLVYRESLGQSSLVDR